MRLIHNWRRCLVHAWSTRFIALGFVSETLLQLWAMMPPETRNLLPYSRWVPFFFFGAAFVARHFRQERLQPVKEEARQE